MSDPTAIQWFINGAVHTDREREEAQEALDDLVGRVADLEVALRPFADMADAYEAFANAGWSGWSGKIRLPDVYRAKELLESPPVTEKEGFEPSMDVLPLG